LAAADSPSFEYALVFMAFSTALNFSICYRDG
jgi:hypothetical protein